MARCKVNGKMYVGMTIHTIKHRWKQHCKCALKEPFDHKVPFHNAIRAHGADSFELSLLEECDDHESMCAAEQAWIERLNTYVNAPDSRGYNAAQGGQGSNGYKLTPEQRQRKIDGQRSSPNFKRTAVAQIDRNGNIVATFRSMEAAFLATGIMKVNEVVKGKRNHAGGFVWCRAHEAENVAHDIREGRRTIPDTPTASKRVCQLDRNGALIKTFENVSDAHEQTSAKHILEVLLGALRSAGGHYWILEERYLAGERPTLDRPPQRLLPVEQIDDQGNVVATYRSVMAAFKATGISRIGDVVHGLKPKAGGYSWRLAPQARL